MNDDLLIEGVNHISSKRARQITGYAQDYIGQLIRDKKISGKKIGTSWYVDEASLNNYVASRPAQSFSNASNVVKKNSAENLNSSKNLGYQTFSARQESEDFLPKLNKKGIPSYLKEPLPEKDFPVIKTSAPNMYASIGKKIAVGVLSIVCISGGVVFAAKASPNFARLAEPIEELASNANLGVLAAQFLGRPQNANLAAVAGIPNTTSQIFSEIGTFAKNLYDGILGLFRNGLAILFHTSSNNNPSVTASSTNTYNLTENSQSVSTSSSLAIVSSPAVVLPPVKSPETSTIFINTISTPASSAPQSVTYNTIGVSEASLASQLAGVYAALSSQINTVASQQALTQTNVQNVYDNIRPSSGGSTTVVNNNISVPSDITFEDSTTTNATTTNLYVSGTLTGAGLSDCAATTDKLLWDATTGQFVCGVDAGSTGSGITAIMAQYSPPQGGATQTFATTSDANIVLTITSAGDTETFSPSWTGVLAPNRGGTGISNPSAAGVLVGSYAGGGYQQIATSSLGLLTTDVAEGTNLYYTQARFDTALESTTTLNNLAVLKGLTDLIAARATTTNATTTNFAFTNLSNALLAVNSTGQVIASSTIGDNQLQFSTIGATSPNSTLSFGSAASLGSTFTADLNLAAQNIWTAASTTFVGGLTIGTATTTNATSTNFFAATASTTNLFFTNGTGNLTGNVTGNITGSAPAGSLTGTTLASNVVNSSLTSVGTLSAGAVPASLITSGTFGAGNYIFPAQLQINSSTTLQNFTGINATTTNATTTGSFFAATASSTNLFSSLLNVGSSGLSLNVTSSGLVGIGVTPVQKLDVDGQAGNPATSGTAQNGLFRLEQTSDNGILDTGVRSGGLGVWFQSTSKLDLSSKLPLLFNPNGGNVGIGTLSPNFTLEVNGTASSTQLFSTLATFSFASTTNLLVLSSTTLQNFTGINATTTNATTTGSFFATTASTTNLFFTAGVGNLTGNLIGNITGSAPAGSLTGTTLASNVVSSSLTSVGTLATLNLGNADTSGSTGNGWITSSGRNLIGESSTNHVMLNASSAPGGNFEFVTGGGENTILATLLNTGNFGLNTTNPNFTFEVNGTASTTQLFATKATFSFASTTNLLVLSSTTLQNFTFVNATGTNATTTNFFTTTASSTNLFSSLLNVGSNGTGLNVTSTGLVGIGVVPVQKLDVDGVAGNPATSGTTQNGLFRLEQTTDNGILDVGVRTGGAGVWFQSTSKLDLSSKLPLLFNPNGGNVGIGTLSPNFTLEVNGTASSTQLFSTLATFSFASTTNFLVLASSTLQNFTAINSTSTNATTTVNAAVEGILQVGGGTPVYSHGPLVVNGNIGGVTFGGDFISINSDPVNVHGNSAVELQGGSVYTNGTNTGINTTSPNFTLEVNGTASTTQLFSTLATFSKASTTNFLATASSTIGNGATGGGLTIFGGATTTGQFLALSSTTLQNFTGLKATTTAATSTSFFSATNVGTNITANTSLTVGSTPNLLVNSSGIAVQGQNNSVILSLSGTEPRFSIQDGSNTKYTFEATGSNFDYCQFGVGCNLMYASNRDIYVGPFSGGAEPTPSYNLQVNGTFGGASLSSCAGGTNALTWTAGSFGCNTISSGSGTVTSIATSNGITGGTITTSGTLSLDQTFGAIWTAASTTFVGGLTMGKATTTNATSTDMNVSSKFTGAGLTTCNTAGSDALTWSGGQFGCNTITGGGAGSSPGGSDTDVQFNSGGASFGGSSDLTWDGTALTASNLNVINTLNVLGTLTINSGAYSFPSSDGSNGQVLTTDGSGSVSWETAAASVWTQTDGYTLTYDSPNTGNGAVISTDPNAEGAGGSALTTMIFPDDNHYIQTNNSAPWVFHSSDPFDFTADANFQGHVTLEGLTTTDTEGCGDDSSSALATDDSGVVYCLGGLSDERLKTDISTTTDALSQIDELTPVSFYWKDNSIQGTESTHQQFGFLAQELQTVFPNLVNIGAPTKLTPGGTYEIDYTGLISPLVASVQELDAKIGILQNIQTQIIAGSSAVISTSTVNSMIGGWVSSMGASVVAGVWNITNLVTNSLTVTTEYANNISADSISTKSLTIGDAENHSGITLYDQTNGTPYCVQIINGVMESLQGVCSGTSANNSSGNSNSGNSDTNNGSDNSGGGSSENNGTSTDSSTGDASSTPDNTNGGSSDTSTTTDSTDNGNQNGSDVSTSTPDNNGSGSTTSDGGSSSDSGSSSDTSDASSTSSQ